MSRKKTPLILLGATGGSSDLIEIHMDCLEAQHTNYELIGLLDDKPELQGKSILDVPVLGGFSKINDLDSSVQFATGIGSVNNYSQRKSILENLKLDHKRWAKLIHPTAYISRFASIEEGAVIHTGAYVGIHAKVGKCCLILPQSYIGHDSKIGDYSIINAGVCIASEVTIGCSCLIGANAEIRQNISIGNQSIVGFGSTVTKSFKDKSTVWGSPAIERT